MNWSGETATVGKIIRLLARFVLVALANCATGNADIVDHAFGFDAVHDSPGFEILDYRYGESKQPGARPTQWELERGAVRQGTSTYGDMLRGDLLFVKWRDKATGEIYEDTVDLRDRLPKNIKRHEIYFIVSGSHLHVYLIAPEKLNPNPCPGYDGLRKLRVSKSPDDKIFGMYCDRKITRLYPDLAKK